MSTAAAAMDEGMDVLKYLDVQIVVDNSDEECEMCGFGPSTKYIHNRLRKSFHACDACLMYTTPEELKAIVSLIPEHRSAL